MNPFLQDLRTAARTLRRSTGFTVVVILTLALGIGANTAIFSVINSVLLRPLPYRDPDRLVMFWETFPGLGDGFAPITEGGFVDYQTRNQALASMSGFRIRSLENNRPVTLTSDSAAPVALNAVTCSWNLFETLGVQPLTGRAFVESEGEPGAPPVLIVSHGFWRTHLGGSPDVVGRRVILDGVSREIVGVLPPDFFFPPPLQVLGRVRQGVADVFFPYVFDPDERRLRSIRTVARLADGLTPEEAEARLDTLAAQLVKEFSNVNVEGQNVVLLPLHGQAVSASRSVLWILMFAVGLILLIACVNVANLFVARMLSRRREMAIRVAIGARKRDLVRQLLLESLLLALAGGLIGLVLAGLSLRALVAVTSAHVPRLGPVTIDPTVLMFTVAVSLLTGLVFGLAPALRSTPPNLSQELREGERGNTGGPGRALFRKALVVAEVSLAAVLLIGAGLLMRSLWLMQQTDLGFDPDRVVTVSALPPQSKYPEPRQIVDFYEKILTELRAQPGVEQAGAVSQLPLSGGLFGGNFDIVGRDFPTREESEAQRAAYRVISEGYLETMRIPLLEGREFNPGDRSDSRRVLLIDRALADRLWADGSWVSTQLQVLSPDHIYSIVGVVGNIHNETIRSDNQGVIYLPMSQVPNRAMNLAVRTRLPTESLMGSIRQLVGSIDRDVAVRLETMESHVAQAQAGLRAPALLFATFAGLAVLLAGIGLYGLMSYLVGQRQKEIGIRLALGANRRDIVGRIGLQTAYLIGLGLVIGIGGALILSRLLTDLLFSVQPTDPLTYAAVALTVLALSALAGYLPARRASRVDPIDALRAD